MSSIKDITSQGSLGDYQDSDYKIKNDKSDFKQKKSQSLRHVKVKNSMNLDNLAPQINEVEAQREDDIIPNNEQKSNSSGSISGFDGSDLSDEETKEVFNEIKRKASSKISPIVVSCNIENKKVREDS